MTKLKYAGLCAAGIAVDLACLLIDLYIGSALGFDVYLYFGIGILLCIGSGFAHVAFMNIIRKKLVRRLKWYLLAVFAATLALSGLAVLLAIVLDMTVWAERSGFFNFSPAVSIVLIAIGVAAVTSYSGIATLCVQPLLGVAEPDKGEEHDK